MTDKDPTLQDVWRLLGSMNKRLGERFDGVERQFVTLREDFATLRGEFADLRSQVNVQMGALKGAIEARDFRLDEHGRRLNELESSR